MRTTNKTLALLVLASLSCGAVAQDDVLNSAPIDVDGYLQDKPVTDGELEQIKNEHNKQKNITQLNKEKAKELGKLSGQTEKLLDSQDVYIDSKIESQKAIKEFNRKSAENEKKLKCMLEEDTSPECAKWVKKRADEPTVAMEDRVQTAQAAPVVVAPAPLNEGPLAPFEEIKLIPYAGATNYTGKVEKLETEFAGGLKLESNVASRLSVGIGGNYSQFNTEDFGSNYLGQPYFTGYNNFYGSGGREINFTNMGLEVYTKFFITRGERFRPYVGAGLGYNRMSLKYADNANPGQLFGNNFGNEETTTSYMTGNLTAGSEILVTRSVGFNVEFQYARGFGGGSADNRQNTFNAPDQRRLQELSDELIEANAMSVFAGMLIVF
jgi:opacity protein-like surface antigen